MRSLFGRLELGRVHRLWQSASERMNLRALKALARLTTVCAPLALASLAAPEAAEPEPTTAGEAPSQPAKIAPELDPPTHLYSRKDWLSAEILALYEESMPR